MTPERRRKYLKNAAAYYLSRHGASEEHLRRILGRKAIRRAQEHEQDPEDWHDDVAAVVTWFVEQGFVNDAEYARSKANMGLVRGKSARRLEQELKAKGVDGSTARQAMANSDHEDDIACIRFARRRRLGPFGRGDAEDETREVARFARAGFGFDTIRRVRALTREEAEDALLDGVMP